MKIRNSLFESPQYVDTMNKIHGSHQLSVMDAFRINRLFKQLSELQSEYQELKKGLLETHGEEQDSEASNSDVNSDGTMYTVSKEKQEDFRKEMGDLLNIEHDLGIEKIPFPSKIDDGILVADMDVLDIFFDFGFDDPVESTT